MRNSLSIITVALTLISTFAPEAKAQSDAADATMQVNILGNTVTVVNTAGLDFGSAFASDGVLHSSDLGTVAAWHVDVTGAISVQVSFSLPTELSDAGNTSVIAVSYGPTAGTFNVPGAGEYLFDPAAGHVHSVAGLTDFTVRLGEDWNVDGTGDVSLDPTGAGPGLHAGVVTLTVTVL